MAKDIVLIAHNIRSTYNIGSLLRTCDGLGIAKMYYTGYTPYPSMRGDSRLPHIAQKLNDQIHKTALGAEASVISEPCDNIIELCRTLKEQGYTLVALEQSSSSIPLPSYASPERVAVVIGEEVHGIESKLLEQCDVILEIPMVGKKESFNVSTAAAMALYQLRFHTSL